MEFFDNDASTTVVTRVITFFFPYDSKIEESSRWSSGDPRDFSIGHPGGHERLKFSDESDESHEHRNGGFRHGGSTHNDNERSSYTVSWMLPTSTQSSPLSSSSILPIHEPVASDTTLALVLIFYAFLFLFAIMSNILVANLIKRYRWGMKMAILFFLCLIGSILCLTNTLHFLASGYHLVKRKTNSSVILQTFAIIAWIDHAIGYALLVFVLYLAIFCFKFYWKNKTRSIEWGRRFILPAVVSAWLLAFLLAGFSAFFQCDTHLEEDQCIRMICATSNIFSSLFTELLTRVRLVIPVVIIVMILLSARVGSSKQRQESIIKVEGADVHGDRELLLICSLLFLIYEISYIIPHTLVFFCISPLTSVCSYHFGVLVSTIATPISVIFISKDMRNRMGLLYTCGKSAGKTVPQGSYAHVAKKYQESSGKNEKRRESNFSMFSQDLSMTSNDLKTMKKLSVISEEPSVVNTTATTAQINKVQDDNLTGKSVEEVDKNPRINSAGILNVPRRMSMTCEATQPMEYQLTSKRRFSNFSMPQIGDTSNLAMNVAKKTEKFLVGSKPNVQIHLPQHIFVHHINDSNKI